ncbi:PilW family protein [Paenisporosarcina macmurdoensis]|uniref:PilW family protein n=1 Tax=Paenisporosarcina macmurdoensis TaxID=212659 RepID=A0ABW1L9X4_9BACL
MKYMNNQKGLSLVELMAALALVSIVAVLIMTTLTLGIKKSVAENDKVRVQQEANILVAKLLNNHREGDLYCLIIIGEELILGGTKMEAPNSNNQVCDFPVVNSSYINNLYDSTIFNITSEIIGNQGPDLIEESPVDLTTLPISLINPTSNQKPIDPAQQDLELSIKISYKSDDKKSNYIINTTLIRYKTN